MAKEEPLQLVAGNHGQHSDDFGYYHFIKGSSANKLKPWTKCITSTFVCTTVFPEEQLRNLLGSMLLRMALTYSKGKQDAETARHSLQESFKGSQTWDWSGLSRFEIIKKQT